jgi:hypothetical protein
LIEDTTEVWATAKKDVIKKFRRKRPKSSREGAHPLDEENVGLCTFRRRSFGHNRPMDG